MEFFSTPAGVKCHDALADANALADLIAEAQTKTQALASQV
jgi:DNA polymerase III epsilon subunit-like protein